ncbi:hypothetical protein RhiirA1_464596 [Rhizophagus irregularis]|uniref:Uncharacterized protein n=1 Tax=Rhizophagus irregularis TaxID=588596 RepID=A0A2N0RHQ7_9GLOM|nr:hypothetical protein RhiirA1_464596 [Rhizophagus irregularis]CAB4477776.1 unnamed protein product [Rhizophagus irregularis]CAB5385745.1 unnamed protein product [Rhizophagus irregularis]CAG8626501.1 1207_t:CDS:2 [Rhizophagus irregularis]
MIVLQLGQCGNNIPREILAGLVGKGNLYTRYSLIVMKDEVSLYGMRIPFLDEFYSDDDLYYELPHINKSVERSCLPKSNPVKTAMVHDSSSESSESSGGEFFDTVIPKKKQE